MTITAAPAKGKKSSATSSGGRRAATGPVKARNRSWGLVVAAALLVVVMALVVGVWGVAVGHKTTVLAVSGNIAKGTVIQQSQLEAVPVAGVSGAIPVGQSGSVVGQTAAVDLVPGEILTQAMLTSKSVPGAGQAIVGLNLDPTKVPATIGTGNTVSVILVPSGNSAANDTGSVLATDVRVMSVSAGSQAANTTVVSVVVPSATAPQIAAAASQNRIALIVTAR